MNPLFSPTRKWGQTVMRNGGPQIGACLILSDFFVARERSSWANFTHTRHRQVFLSMTDPLWALFSMLATQQAILRGGWLRHALFWLYLKIPREGQLSLSYTHRGRFVFLLAITRRTYTAHIQTHTEAHAYAHRSAYTRTHTHTCTHTCTLAHTHTHTHIHVHTHTPTHARTHAHTHTHTQIVAECAGRISYGFLRFHPKTWHSSRTWKSVEFSEQTFHLDWLVLAVPFSVWFKISSTTPTSNPRSPDYWEHDPTTNVLTLRFHYPNFKAKKAQYNCPLKCVKHAFWLSINPLHVIPKRPNFLVKQPQNMDTRPANGN